MSLEKRFSEKVGKTIYAELIKERPIVIIKDEKDKKVKYVANPLTYPLKADLGDKEEDFRNLLERLVLSGKKGVKEEVYNRGYLYDVKNKGVPFGPLEGWLVFDQITPFEIELCDIVRYTPKTTYLYHVKEVFGQDTRIACSQILNGARQLRSSLSLHQSTTYLQLLWDRGTTCEKEEGWQSHVKKQLLHLGKANFKAIFQDRRIVFVYAYLSEMGKSFQTDASKPMFFSQNDLDEIDRDPAIQKQIKDRFLDSEQSLNGAFYASTQEKFSLNGVDHNKAKAIHKKLATFKAPSQSTLAKLDLIHVARELESLNFEFKICEIEQPGFVRSASQTKEAASDAEEDDQAAVDNALNASSDSIHSEAPPDDNAPTGLINIGNSCYINALLQVFNFIPPLMAIINNPPKK